MEEGRKEFTVVHLYEACRAICEASEKQTSASLRLRETTRRSAIALAAPFAAGAAIAAFLDEMGPTLATFIDERVKVLRDGQKRRQPPDVLYGACFTAWLNGEPDTDVVANLKLLNGIRNDLVHPDRVPARAILDGLGARGLLLGDANWPHGLERSPFPSDHAPRGPAARSA